MVLATVISATSATSSFVAYSSNTELVIRSVRFQVFGTCLLDVRNDGDDDIVLEKDQHLTVDCLRLSVAYAASRKAATPQVQQWRIIL